MVTRTHIDAAALTLHLRVVKPVVGCSYALQRGKVDIEQVHLAGSADIEFALSVVPRFADGGADLRGPNVQGPRGARFVYINTGTRAGQHDTCWTRRAKVPLRGVIDLLVSAATAGTVAFEASIDGRARDGGPACASVALLGAGWRPRH